MLVTNILYPGIDPGTVLAANAIDSQGIAPARATISVSAQAVGTIAPLGDFTFSDGVNPSVTWPECRVANVAASGGSGQPAVLTVLLEDARWKWAGGQLSGRHNVPAEYFATVPLVTFAGQEQFGNQNFTQIPIPPGEEPIRPETAKTAQELCILCLKEMGVKNYDVSPIDPKSYPAVEWDSEVPARALQALVERYGCRVVYRKDQNKVYICKEGAGVPMPDGPFLFDAPSLTPKPVPKRIVVRSDFIRYQRRFGLEMVMMEFDGSWRPAKDVSYCPIVDGKPYFGYVGPDGFLPVAILDNLPSGRTLFDAEAMCGAYIYRAYRITNKEADGTPMLFPNDSGEMTHHFNYLKQVYLLPNKVEVTKDDLARHSPAPAQCFGRYDRIDFCGVRNPSRLFDNTTAQTEVVMPFSIDAEHGVIIFAQPIYAFKIVPPGDPGADGTRRRFYPADIVLETACHFATQNNWQFRRKNFPIDVPGGLSDLTTYAVRRELLATVTWEYNDDETDGGDNAITKVTTNTDKLAKRAAFYLQGELLKLTPDIAETKAFCGVLAAFPDGAIQQVSTEFAAGDKTKPATTISRNTEHSVYLPNYQGRRLREESDLRSADRKADDKAHEDRQARGDKG